MPDLTTAIRTAAVEMNPAHPKAVMRVTLYFPNSYTAQELLSRTAAHLNRVAVTEQARAA